MEIFSLIKGLKSAKKAAAPSPPPELPWVNWQPEYRVAA
jgi:hypothetical protein